MAAGTSSLPTDEAADRLAPANYLGPVKESSSFDGGAIMLEVPDVGATPKMEWADAYAKACLGNGICGAASGPTISLASVTTRAAGTARTDNSIDPLLDKALTYVFVWRNEPCSPTGGPPITDRTAGPPRVYACTVVNLVDANTGQSNYVAEGPGV